MSHNCTSLYAQAGLPLEQWEVYPHAVYATHAEAKLYMLTHDGPWWIPAPSLPGETQLFGIVTATPPPVGACRHCGVAVPADQLLAECPVEGTPLKWQSTHCWKCYDSNPDCPTTCTFLPEEGRR